MSVTRQDGVIVLAGDCGVEEAEVLLNLLQDNPAFPVDLGAAGTVHTALWQVLLMLSPRLVAPPDDPFIRQWIIPALQRHTGAEATT